MYSPAELNIESYSCLFIRAVLVLPGVGILDLSFEREGKYWE